MSADAWILVADERPIGGMLRAARGLGGKVTAAVAGPRALAASVAAAGPDAVAWIEPAEQAPPEACAAQVADAVAAAAPRVLLASTAPPSRVLLGAAATRIGAAVLDAVSGVAIDGDDAVVTRAALEGRVVETLRVSGPVAGIFAGEDVPAETATPAPVEAIASDRPAVALRVVDVAPAAETGLRTAARVVAVGLGVRSRADLAPVEELAAALGAELACTMPLADDLRWFGKERYIGRSGQHIAPDLYVAIGLSGQPQHLEGVRDAHVVVGINSDPEAPIFKHCDHGIVGDLYEVVPALTKSIDRKQES